jgi:hypothetical protein
VCDEPCLACDPAAGCVPKPATAACNDGSVCTLGDHCSGVANTCVPLDVLACTGGCLTGSCDARTGCVRRAPGEVCRDVAGACDVVEVCDGMSPDCPADEVLPATIECRAAAGPCDVAEHCTGAEGVCPADTFADAAVGCDDGSLCTLGDHCRGDANGCVGAPRSCDAPCLTGICDPHAGCVARDGVGALTCRASECKRARLGRKVRTLSLRIDRALERGKRLRERRVMRLRRLLARCGIEGL